MSSDLTSSDQQVRPVQSKDQSKTVDWGYRLILSLVFVIAVWLVMMPWIPAISRTLMYRFHLRSQSFATWAVQQPIPAMYSFYNTTEVRNLPNDVVESGLIDPLLFDPLGLPEGSSERRTGKFCRIGVLGGRTINHFPTREITFANSRNRYLRDTAVKWFVLESSYRGTTLRSVFELQHNQRVGWEMKRIDD